MNKKRDLTDAEIDALLERFDQTAQALQRKIVAQFAVEAVASRDTIATLLSALTQARQFIANGIQFGYIDKPKPGSPEAKTLPMIEAAIAKATQS